MAGSSLTRLLGALQDEPVVGGDVSGTLSTTLTSVTFAGVGTETISGTLASTLGSVIAAASGTETLSGSLTATLDGIAFAGSGSVVSAGVDGALSFTTGSITFAGQGTETISGSLSTSLAGITFAGSGLETISGSQDATLDSIAFAGTGSELINSAIAITLDSIVFNAAGSVVTNDANGALSVILEGIGFSASGTTEEPIQQTGSGGYFAYHQKKLRKKIEYDEQKAKEAYAELLELAPIEVKKQAIAIVKPFAETNKKTPAPASIDWVALEREAYRVDALLALWQEQLGIEREDEEILLLM